MEGVSGISALILAKNDISGSVILADEKFALYLWFRFSQGLGKYSVIPFTQDLQSYLEFKNQFCVIQVFSMDRNIDSLHHLY